MKEQQDHRESGWGREDVSPPPYPHLSFEQKMFFHLKLKKTNFLPVNNVRDLTRHT